MLPEVEEYFDENLEVEEQPSFDFRLSFNSGRINGHVEEIEAVKQAIFMILNTERYRYLIYSWDYGIELVDLYGMPVDYCVAEIERRVTEALLMDDRIIEVADFDFDIQEKRTIKVTFVVYTIYGDADVERVVQI